MASPQSSTPRVTQPSTTNSGRQIETDTGVSQSFKNTEHEAFSGGSSSSSVDVDPASCKRHPATLTRKKASATEASKREARIRLYKERIAQDLGRDVDSITPDDRLAYRAKMKKKDDAEYARQQALSPEEKRQESIQSFAEDLKRRFERQAASGELQLSLSPMFQLQETPRRSQGTCKLNGCAYLVLPGDYRIAVKSGSNSFRNPDYYHLDCFEETLNLLPPHDIFRLECDYRKYPPDHGAQCILDEYICERKRRINSATTTDEWKRAEHLWDQKRQHLKAALYSNDSLFGLFFVDKIGNDSPSKSDTDWDITEYIHDALDENKHPPLSRALANWKYEMRLATTEIADLSEDQRMQRDYFDDPMIEMIKSYALVRMPSHWGYFAA
ncbi:hypothetical protein BDV12DRAFT_202107 [Aspergillus spectabilis]